MTFKHPQDLKNSPYFDDFNEEKQFLQMLFKPGYAVQARELTQLQSILQNQISKVSDHLFVDGTKVFGGEASVGTYFFARVKTNSMKDALGVSISFATFKQYFYNSLTENYKSFVPSNVCLDGQIYTTRNGIFNLEQDFQIQIIDVIDPLGNDEGIIIFKFIKGSLENLNKFTITSTHPLVLKEVTNDNYEGLNASKPLNNPSQNSITFEFINKKIIGNTVYVENFNSCLVAFIEEGIFYKDGRFIKNPKTQIVLNKVASVLPSNKIEIEQSMNTGIGVAYANNLLERRLFSYQSKRIGFSVNVDYVNFVDDSSLLDNASGFLNERAPGADRLKYNLVPTQLLYDENNVEHYDGTDFIEVARVKKGILLFAKENTEYAEILKLFAKRTYDESGSYTVRPFQLEFREHLRNDEFTLNFSANFDYSKVDVGDFIFKTGTTPSSRLAKLINNNIEKLDDSYKYPNDILDEPIGIVKSVQTTKLIIIPLNKVSFNTLSLNEPLSIKQSDISGPSAFANIGSLNGTDTAIEYSYDQQGTYLLSDDEQGSNDKFVCLLGQGKGYVEGFEVETTTPYRLTADKARETISTTTNIDVLLENKILLSGNPVTLFPNTYIDDNIVEEQLTIRSGSVLVQIDFTGIPTEGTASAELIHVSSFIKNQTLNQYIVNGSITQPNRETVLFCRNSDSAPVI
jgi:hypothetical protein